MGVLTLTRIWVKWIQKVKSNALIKSPLIKEPLIKVNQNQYLNKLIRILLKQKMVEVEK